MLHYCLKFMMPRSLTWAFINDYLPNVMKVSQVIELLDEIEPIGSETIGHFAIFGTFIKSTKLTQS